MSINNSVHEKACKRVFVCSPYAGDEVRNYKLANQYMHFVKFYGHIPLAPHAMYPAAFPEHEKGNREFGFKCGLSLLEHWAQELWYFEGASGISQGMQQEIDYARALGIPIKNMTNISIEFINKRKIKL